MRGVVGSMRHTSARAAVNSWMAYASRCGVVRRQLRGALVALRPRGRALRCAFNSWSVHNLSKVRMKRAVKALLTRSHRVGFNTWSYAVQRKRRLLHTTIKGIKSMQLSSHRAALNGWCAHVAESRRLEKLLEHSLSTVRHAKASKVWRQWSGVAESGRAKEDEWRATVDRLWQRRAFVTLAGMRNVAAAEIPQTGEPSVLMALPIFATCR